MIGDIAFIGFGEAAQAFARPGARAYDVLPDKAATYAAADVRGFASAREALFGAGAALSLVTADQALPAARDYAPLLRPGALWLDMNSVAPGTKRTAAEIVEAGGGRYVDVAIMAPVQPARLAVPLLVAGPHTEDAGALLRNYGFRRVRSAGPRVGDASAIKMIRSVMVKGIEALSAECILAAHSAGVSDAVLASLDASWTQLIWSDRIDYNLDRMLAHGLRRAAEMEEVAKMLAELGIDPAMTRSIAARQRQMGSLGITPPEGLAAKLAAITSDRKDKAA